MKNRQQLHEAAVKALSYCESNEYFDYVDSTGVHPQSPREQSLQLTKYAYVVAKVAEELEKEDRLSQNRVIEILDELERKVKHLKDPPIP